MKYLNTYESLRDKMKGPQLDGVAKLIADKYEFIKEYGFNAHDLKNVNSVYYFIISYNFINLYVMYNPTDNPIKLEHIMVNSSWSLYLATNSSIIFNNKNWEFIFNNIIKFFSNHLADENIILKEIEKRQIEIEKYKNYLDLTRKLKKETIQE